jgi:hypothetical protein
MRCSLPSHHLSPKLCNQLQPLAQLPSQCDWADFEDLSLICLPYTGSLFVIESFYEQNWVVTLHCLQFCETY